MKTSLTTPLILATILFSTSTLAAMAPVAKCNDCSATAALDAAKALAADNVYVVDFVNATAQKFVSDDKGNTVVAKMSLGDITRLNQQFDYRKTHLRALNR